MKTTLVNSAVAVAVLFGSMSLSAKEMTHDQMIQKSVKTEMQKQNKRFSKEDGEVMIALHQTFKALTAIGQNKDKEALKLLKEADKEFTKVLKKNPDLKLVPVENRVELFAFSGNVDVIKTAVESAEKLLKHHRTQSARDILLPLKDEMDITTLFIPMQTYPAVIKTAIVELEKGHKEIAVGTLVDGMSTLVGEQVVIPLSFLMSQDLIVKASQLDKTKKDEALKLLGMASDELKKSVYLGYADETTPAYKELQKSITNLEKEIKGKNKVEKLYENLKKEFKTFIDKFRNDKQNMKKPMGNKAEAEVEKYQQEQMKKALKEATQFKSEVSKDLKKTVK